MRDKLYVFTKSNIVSARISDDELENVERIMEETNMTASKIMRKALQMMIERFDETGQLNGLHT